MDQERMQAWRGFLVAHRHLVDALERELEERDGMPLTFFDVLVHLEALGGRARMSELADRVLISRSGLTRLVDRMVSAGFVERQQCPSDRRGLEAVLTPAGQEALEAAAPVHLDGVDRMFMRHLSDDDARVLDAVFTRILGGLGITLRES